MVRPPLSALDRERGRLLGATLRAARGHRSMVEVAAAAGIPVETLRKIESGRVPTPAFFTVAALAGALGLGLDEIARLCAPDSAAPLAG
jgi:transcriptional regulator with XRE-family HTH domain